MLKKLLWICLTILATVAVLSLAIYKIALQPPSIAVPSRADAIISGVTVVNPGVGRAENQSIVVHAGKIVMVRPTLPTDPAPVCRNCVALPGLIDAHVHNPPALAFGNQELFALMDIAHGVTTVRDTGQADESVQSLAKRLNEGTLVGPHMLRCGPVLDGDPPGWGAARKVGNAAQAKVAVDEIAATGVDCIKVYNKISFPVYQAIRAAAARRRLPVIGHVPHTVGLANIYDFEAQHFTGIPYYMGGQPSDGSDVDEADFLKMSDADIDAALSLIKSHNISLLPTLANIRLRLIASDPARYPRTPDARYLPDIFGSFWNGSAIVGHPVGPRIAMAAKFHGVALSVARKANDKGIPVLAGTDTLMPWVVPGESLLLEIDDLAEAFGNNETALASATTVNGKHLSAGQIGQIGPGYRADILLLPSDPTRDLAALKAWRILYADGRRYDRDVVDGWLEKYNDHFHSPIYSFVMRMASGYVAGDGGHR